MVKNRNRLLITLVLVAVALTMAAWISVADARITKWSDPGETTKLTTQSARSDAGEPDVGQTGLPKVRSTGVDPIGSPRTGWLRLMVTIWAARYVARF